MPYIHTKVSVPLSPEKENMLKTKLGEVIAILPGKSESWLMLEFEDNCRLYFKGDSSPLAFVEVKLFGASSPAAYENMTGAVTALLHEELGIEPANIYVAYEELSTWGWNGRNL